MNEDASQGFDGDTEQPQGKDQGPDDWQDSHAASLSLQALRVDRLCPTAVPRFASFADLPKPDCCGPAGRVNDRCGKGVLKVARVQLVRCRRQIADVFA
jgi:hypothetical protein